MAILASSVVQPALGAAFSSSQTLAVNESAGVLNAVQVFWPLSTSRAELDEIVVARIA